MWISKPFLFLYKESLYACGTSILRVWPLSNDLYVLFGENFVLGILALNLGNRLSADLLLFSFYYAYFGNTIGVLNLYFYYWLSSFKKERHLLNVILPFMRSRLSCSKMLGEKSTFGALFLTDSVLKWFSSSLILS